MISCTIIIIHIWCIELLTKVDIPILLILDPNHELEANVAHISRLIKAEMEGAKKWKEHQQQSKTSVVYDAELDGNTTKMEAPLPTLLSLLRSSKGETDPGLENPDSLQTKILKGFVPCYLTIFKQ